MLESLGGASLIHPYYNDEKRLALQLKVWGGWSSRVCKNLDITLIDDGGSRPLALTDAQKQMFHDKGIKIAVYRILKDLKWNTPGALNLGVLMAPKPWVLFMDSDCFIDSENAERLLDYHPAITHEAKFARKRYGDPATERLELVRYLPCAMLMHKTLFNKVGCFDEDFTGANSGGYGFFDNEFDGRIIKIGAWGASEFDPNHTVAPGVIVGEWMPSVYGGAPVARADEHHRINKKLMYAKEKGDIGQNRQILNFPWQQVYSNWQ